MEHHYEVPSAVRQPKESQTFKLVKPRRYNPSTPYTEKSNRYLKVKVKVFPAHVC